MAKMTFDRKFVKLITQFYSSKGIVNRLKHQIMKLNFAFSTPFDSLYQIYQIESVAMVGIKNNARVKPSVDI